MQIFGIERADCAWLWIDVMHSLRQGVRLKKCQHVTHVSRTSLEVELSLFEILMQDIRFRRYTLHKVMVNGEPPLNVTLMPSQPFLTLSGLGHLFGRCNTIPCGVHAQAGPDKLGIRQDIESVIANTFVPSDFLVDGQVSGPGIVHPLLTLNFFSTWMLSLQVVSSTLKRRSSSSAMDGLQRRRRRRK